MSASDAEDEVETPTDPPTAPAASSTDAEAPSMAIRAATYKIIEIINEQCMRATTQIFGERKQAMEAYNDLHREHVNFRRNVNSVITDYKQRLAILQYERDQAIVDRDRLLATKTSMSSGMQKMIQKIEEYNEDMKNSGADFRIEVPKRSTTAITTQRPAQSGSAPESLNGESELDMLRKRAEVLQKQNELLFMQVCTAETERSEAENAYKKRIAELERQIESL